MIAVQKLQSQSTFKIYYINFILVIFHVMERTLQVDRKEV